MREHGEICIDGENVKIDGEYVLSEFGGFIKGTWCH